MSSPCDGQQSPACRGIPALSEAPIRTFEDLHQPGQERGAEASVGHAVIDAECEFAARPYLHGATAHDGAVALAALLSGKAPKCDGASVVVISGANVDPAMFAEIIAG